MYIIIYETPAGEQKNAHSRAVRIPTEGKTHVDQGNQCCWYVSVVTLTRMKFAPIKSASWPTIFDFTTRNTHFSTRLHNAYKTANKFLSLCMVVSMSLDFPK
jgi:hypothetical protein